MAKKTATPVLRYHTVSIGNGRGYSDTEYLVRTDGTTFEKQEQERMKTHVSLKELIDQLVPLLEKHPDAEVDQEQEKHDDDYYTVIEWWVPLAESDPLVAELLAQAKAAEENQRKRDEKELERLKKERPELFKKK